MSRVLFGLVCLYEVYDVLRLCECFGGNAAHFGVTLG